MILQEFKNSSNHTYATIEYDEENKCISDTWEGMFGTQENFRKVLVYIVAAVQERKVTSWLADLSKMNGSFDGSKKWIIETVVPAVITAGLQFEAIVLPKNIFSKLSAKEAIMKIHNFELRQFDDLDQAKTWLKEVNLPIKL